MRITSLTLENFRGFASLELDLDRDVTVLVGSNGSGKSSVLDALSIALGAVASSVLQRVLTLPSVSPRDVRRGADKAHIVARLSLDGVAVRAGLEALSITTERGIAFRPRYDAAELIAPEPSRCLGMYYGTTRVATPDLHTRWKDGVPNATEPVDAIIDALDAGPVGFRDLFRWFRDREDFENAEKVSRASLAWSDVELDGVRSAVTALLPGFTRLRFDRGAVRMALQKGGEDLFLDQLSDGERTLLSIVADIARRLAIANPAAEAPLHCNAVILIDEIEQHLHPRLQREVLPALRRAFPNAQFIVTTHSPQVLSSVPASAILVLDSFAAHHLTSPTQGRDTNAILEEVFGVSERPGKESDEVREIAALIHGDQLDEARGRLAVLAAMLSEHDDAVLHLRTKLDFAEAGL